jgi:hypothetical protein
LVIRRRSFIAFGLYMVIATNQERRVSVRKFGFICLFLGVVLILSAGRLAVP